MRVLDMYCGMGGLSLGFALAGLRPIEGHDIWPRAVATYNLNLRRLGCRAEVSDLTKRTPKGDFDVIIGGPPCQPFSRANVGARGEEHPLWPTFPRFFDVVLEKEPLAFLMENVPALLDRDCRPLLEGQLARLRPLYRLAVRVLDAADYGVPQRRKRLFVLGVRRDLGVRPSFPPPSHAPEETATLDGRRRARWLTVMEAIGDIMFSVDTSGYPKKLVRTNPRHGRPLDLGAPSRTVKVDGRGGDFDFHTMLVPVPTEHEAEPLAPHEFKYGFEEVALGAPGKTITTLVRCARRTSHGEIRSYVLPATTVNTKGFVAPPGRHETFCGRFEGGVYRRLTVRECLRLQSFPDWWRFPSGMATTNKYALVGEAVPPILAYRLAVRMARLLGAEPRVPPEEGEWALPYFRRAFHDLLGGGGP